MEMGAAEVIARAFAALFIAVGLLGVLVAAALFLNIEAVLLEMLTIPFGIGLLGISAVLIYISYNLWNLQSWTRVPFVVISCCALLIFPIGTAIGLAGIVFFGFDTGLRQALTGHLRTAVKRR